MRHLTKQQPATVYSKYLNYTSLIKGETSQNFLTFLYLGDVEDIIQRGDMTSHFQMILEDSRCLLLGFSWLYPPPHPQLSTSSIRPHWYAHFQAKFRWKGLAFLYQFVRKWAKEWYNLLIWNTHSYSSVLSVSLSLHGAEFGWYIIWSYPRLAKPIFWWSQMRVYYVPCV